MIYRGVYSVFCGIITLVDYSDSNLTIFMVKFGNTDLNFWNLVGLAFLKRFKSKYAMISLEREFLEYLFGPDNYDFLDPLLTIKDMWTLFF